MNFLDSIINYISPDAGLKRIRSRMAGEVIRQYEGAARGRRTEGWYTTSTSANAEIRSALRPLRDRARDLVRNNPYAKKAIEILANNVVGTGIMPSFQASEATKKRVKSVWKAWAESNACDYNGQLNIYGIQKLVMRTVAESGEALVILRRTTSKDMKGGLPIQLQVVEPDYIDTSRDVVLLETGGGWIQEGIEFDKNGKRVAYWLFDKHPGEHFVIAKNVVSKRVPAEDVLHIYNIERPGQIRGIPFGVSAFLRLKDFDDYEDAQLVRQKIAACFAAFVTDSGDAIVQKQGDDDLPERLEPGIIEKLPSGKEIHFASPPAAEGYSDYTRKILQAIASAYGVTYEALTGDLSNVNFSSGRMGWLEFHRNVSDLQNNMLIPMLLDGIWNWVLGSNRVVKAFPAAVEVEWTAPRREMIDPMNETKAASEAVRNGFKSWSETVRELGYEPASVLVELEADAKAFDKAGIKPVSDPRFDANRPEPTADSSQKITQPQ